MRTQFIALRNTLSAKHSIKEFSFKRYNVKSRMRNVDMSNREEPVNFIEKTIQSDLDSGGFPSIRTRFPPEPNGYLHIGHAKSICLNFGLATSFSGECNLRFDDTNPEKEDGEFVRAIIEDVKWLGFQWDGEIRYASDYFLKLYEWAQHLVAVKKAYVCELDLDEIRRYRGTLTEKGTNSPYRDRSPEESLALLERMRKGEIDEGAMTLRAKIDMGSPNINMRDPVIYRIKKLEHQRTGAEWKIYPSYDFAHGQGDALEGITHSICTLEFQANRPLYDWFIANLPVPSKPRQYEFGRLNINYLVLSKRKLKKLVDDNLVDGWDDPRMPTLRGLRRRGVSARAIRDFCDSLAIAKTDGIVDISQLEHFVRDDLNRHAYRGMCVMNPVRLSLHNYEAAKTEILDIPRHPDRLDLGLREVPFSSTLLIDRNDFTEDTSLSRKKFKRLVLGDYIRLRGGYIVKATSVDKNARGEIQQINGEIVENTVGQAPPAGVRPRGVIHWVSEAHAVNCTIHQYDRLFSTAFPEEGKKPFVDYINPKSLVIKRNCKAEASLKNASIGEHYQFEREGYYCLDSVLSCHSDLVFNCTIGLRENPDKYK